MECEFRSWLNWNTPRTTIIAVKIASLDMSPMKASRCAWHSYHQVQQQRQVLRFLNRHFAVLFETLKNGVNCTAKFCRRKPSKTQTRRKKIANSVGKLQGTAERRQQDLTTSKLHLQKGADTTSNAPCQDEISKNRDDSSTHPTTTKTSTHIIIVNPVQFSDKITKTRLGSSTKL